MYSKGGVEGGWNSDGWDNDERYKADLDYIRANVTKLVTDSGRQFIPKFLRLGFHDCIGGCNGCVDLKNIDNNGLDEPINTIYPIVKKFKDFYSRADIWVMAALALASAWKMQRGVLNWQYVHIDMVYQISCTGLKWKRGVKKFNSMRIHKRSTRIVLVSVSSSSPQGRAIGR